MKVLQINRNFNNGGAAIAARRLHKKLNQIEGVSSKFLCRHTSVGSNDDLQQLYPGVNGRLVSVGIDRLERLTGYQYLFQKSINSITNTNAFKDADIVHFHITHGGYIDQYFLPEIAKLKPVVWTFHDMWAITGRCAHSYDCDKWKTGCGHCPTPKTYPSQFIDRSAYLWELKNKLYNEVEAHVVCPSDWLGQKVEQSFIKNWGRSIIPNSADLSVFKPYENIAGLRRRFEIPSDKTVLLFVAHGGVENTYKGFDYLKEAIKKSKNRSDIFLVVIGGSKKGNLDYLGIDGISVGEVNDELVLAEYYSAVDYYVLPSVQENLPLTIIESLGCGTPVLAFGVGGIPEMIENQSTGYLANINQKESLMTAIDWACSINDYDYNVMSIRCREFAIANYSIDNYVQSYISLYESLI